MNMYPYNTGHEIHSPNQENGSYSHNSHIYYCTCTTGNASHYAPMILNHHAKIHAKIHPCGALTVINWLVQATMAHSWYKTSMGELSSLRTMQL